MVLSWLAGTTISTFGDAVWTVALAWTAVRTLSPTLAGAVLAAEMLPQAILVLGGGVLAVVYARRAPASTAATKSPPAQ
jgi:hypothetical protein